MQQTELKEWIGVNLVSKQNQDLNKSNFSVITVEPKRIKQKILKRKRKFEQLYLNKLEETEKEKKNRHEEEI